MMTFEEAAALYLADVKSRCAVETLKHYTKRLKPFRAEFGAMRLDEISNDYVLLLIKDLNKWPDGRSKAPDTIRSNVQGWEQWQKWMIENDHLKAPITPKAIKKPAGQKREILPTKEETGAIVENQDPHFIRIFRALRLTGARPGELCRAQIEQYDRVEGEIVLQEHKTAAKTGKPRRIAVGHDALTEILAEAIGDRKTGHIFLKASGKPWKTEDISRKYRGRKDKNGLRKGLCLYLCRHEHATQIYKQTGDLLAVATALGHTQLTTASRYAKVDGETRKKNQRLFNEGLD